MFKEVFVYQVRVFSGEGSLRSSERSDNVEYLQGVVARLQGQQSIKETQFRADKIAYLQEKIERLSGHKPGTRVARPLYKVPHNRHEARFYEAAHAAGWTAVKRGWPDFLCWCGDRIIAVEVKPGLNVLSTAQSIVMPKLAAAGVECYCWSPEMGWSRANGEPDDPFPV